MTGYSEVDPLPHLNRIAPDKRDYRKLARHRAPFRTPEWRSLGERVAKLKDGESIVLNREGDLIEEARKIRNGLNGIKACCLVRRTVKVVDGKIVITRVGAWPTLIP